MDCTKHSKVYEGKSYIELKTILEEACRQHLDGKPQYGYSGILIHGLPGVGKSEMILNIVKSFNFRLVILSISDLACDIENSKIISYKFKEALDLAPSVLCIEDIDAFCPQTDQKGLDSNSCLSSVMRLLDNLDPESGVIVIATTNNVNGVAKCLRSTSKFDKEISCTLPDFNERKEILKNVLQTKDMNYDMDTISFVASKTFGYTAADLNALTRFSWMECTEYKSQVQLNKYLTNKIKLQTDELLRGLKQVVPTILKQNEVSCLKVLWEDICGYETALKIFKVLLHFSVVTLSLGDAMVYCVGSYEDSIITTLVCNETHPKDMYEGYNANPEGDYLKGVLLYGPPGCSKTMLVQAMIYESGFNFFPLKGSNLLSKYVGETEKKLSKVFLDAILSAPSIIFIDEVECLCSQRSKDSSGLVSELLSCIQMIAGKHVILVAATNQPHLVDESLLRPGCFENLICVQLPSYNSRRILWKKLLENTSQVSDEELEVICQLSEGNSGAEIVAAYQEAGNMVMSSFENDEIVNEDEVFVNFQEIKTAIGKVRKRTSLQMLQQIEQFTKERRAIIAS